MRMLFSDFLYIEKGEMAPDRITEAVTCTRVLFPTAMVYIKLHLCSQLLAIYWFRRRPSGVWGEYSDLVLSRFRYTVFYLPRFYVQICSTQHSQARYWGFIQLLLSTPLNTTPEISLLLDESTHNRSLFIRPAIIATPHPDASCIRQPVFQRGKYSAVP